MYHAQINTPATAGPANAPPTRSCGRTVPLPGQGFQAVYGPGSPDSATASGLHPSRPSAVPAPDGDTLAGSAGPDGRGLPADAVPFGGSSSTERAQDAIRTEDSGAGPFAPDFATANAPGGREPQLVHGVGAVDAARSAAPSGETTRGGSALPRDTPPLLSAQSDRAAGSSHLPGVSTFAVGEGHAPNAVARPDAAAVAPAGQVRGGPGADATGSSFSAPAGRAEIAETPGLLRQSSDPSRPFDTAMPAARETMAPVPAAAGQTRLTAAGRPGHADGSADRSPAGTPNGSLPGRAGAANGVAEQFSIERVSPGMDAAMRDAPDPDSVDLPGGTTRADERPGAILAGRTASDAPLARQAAGQIAEIARLLPDRPVEISLNPEELGRVRMTLASSDGALSVTLLAERGETADLMRRHLETLAQEFRQIGYREVNFSFGGQGGNGGAGAQADPGVAEGATPAFEAGHGAGLPDPAMPVRIALSDRMDLRL